MAPPTVRWTTLTVDCADADELGRFYSRLLGWDVTASDGRGWLQLRDPSGGVGLNIQAEDWYEPPTSPERSGTHPKMMHLEMLVDDLAGGVRLVLELGGTHAPHQPADRDANRLRVMLDPAGHPFCLFVDGQ